MAKDCVCHQIRHLYPLGPPRVMEHRIFDDVPGVQRKSSVRVVVRWVGAVAIHAHECVSSVIGVLFVERGQQLLIYVLALPVVVAPRLISSFGRRTQSLYRHSSPEL